ncbi:hypothetical protein [Parvularcula marina]|uniref:hypothetical protein n=1 Tax=Parvularcula marina TaxID=2292771 RepID=UPI003515E1BF
MSSKFKTRAGSVLSFLLVLLIGAMPAQAGAVDDKKPVPISRQAPPLGLYYYCIDPDNYPEDGFIGTVTVSYKVNTVGRTENIEVQSSTNPCLDLSAVTITKVWVYDYMSVRKSSLRDRKLTAALEYWISEETIHQIRELMAQEGGLDRDTQPLLRVPPRLPDFQHCISSSAIRTERVVLEFDVTADGVPINVKTVDATRSCYRKAARISVEQWIYAPKIVDRQPVAREGVRATIEFQVGGG